MALMDLNPSVSTNVNRVTGPPLGGGGAGAGGGGAGLLNQLLPLLMNSRPRLQKLQGLSQASGRAGGPDPFQSILDTIGADGGGGPAGLPQRRSLVGRLLSAYTGGLLGNQRDAQQ